MCVNAVRERKEPHIGSGIFHHNTPLYCFHSVPRILSGLHVVQPRQTMWMAGLTVTKDLSICFLSVPSAGISSGEVSASLPSVSAVPAAVPGSVGVVVPSVVSTDVPVSSYPAVRRAGDEQGSENQQQCQRKEIRVLHGISSSRKNQQMNNG